MKTHDDKNFLNFQVDHMTLLVQPQMYNVAYVLFRIILGCAPDDILYEKRKEWVKGTGEKSMTFAMRVGMGADPKPEINSTIIAVVQPSEPSHVRSHVRDMLNDHAAAAHWQHIALRTPDLIAFHEHASKRGVNFITPILKDDTEDVIQVFSGEWYFPTSPASGMFFEFLQRNPSETQMEKLAVHNRESWFNDKTFLGLYGEKETEYQSKKVTPFLDPELFNTLYAKVGNKELWKISETDIEEAETLMINYAAKRSH